MESTPTTSESKIHILNAEVCLSDQHEALLVPEILESIFSHLSSNDLATVRLVNTTWNNIIIGCCSAQFKLKINREFGRKIKQLTSLYPMSLFLQRIEKIHFAMSGILKSERTNWIRFFELFGGNIKSILLRKWTDPDFIEFLFTSQVQKFLRNIKKLTLFCSLNTKIIQNPKLELLLLSLEKLKVYAEDEDWDYQFIDTQKNFLVKFVSLAHNLKSLSFLGNFCSNKPPPSFWQNIFKTNTLEKLCLYPNMCPYFRMDDEIIRLMTVSGRKSKLHILQVHLDEDIVAPLTFNHFIISHGQMLRKVVIAGLNSKLLEAIPHLGNVNHLNISVWDVEAPKMEAFLENCEASFPKLSYLKLEHDSINRTEQVIPEKQIFRLYQKRNNGSSIWSAMPPEIFGVSD